MKVAIAIPAFLPARDYGGPVQKILRLRPGLEALGLELTVITSTLAAIGEPTLPAGETHIDGLRVLRLSTPFAYRFSPLAVWRGVPRFDVMHVLGAWNGLSYAALTLGRRHARALLWEPIGNLVARGRHAPLKRGLSMVHAQLLNRCDGVIWTSRRELSEARAPSACPSYFRANPCPTEDLAGLPDKQAARRALGLPTEGRLYGYLGRIDARKGVDRLLRTWPGPHAGQLVIAGPVADETLAEQVDAHGRGVRRHPALSAETRFTYLRALDALLLVPEYGENFGNVVVEAMQVHTPVIASTAVGALDYISDPGVVRVEDDEGLRRLLEAAQLPPPPGGLPPACDVGTVAAVQHDIYLRALSAAGVR